MAESRSSVRADREPAPLPWAAAGACGLVAMVVRLAALAAFADSPFTRVMVGDSKGYLGTAELLLAGRLSEIGVFFQSAPLYSLVLAAARLLGEAIWLPVASLQVIAGALASAAVSMIAATVFPRMGAAPWIAGMGAATYAPFVYFDLEVLPASLGTSLVAGALLLALRPAGRGRAALTGAFFGAASILAPALLMVGLWTIAHDLFAARRRAAWTAAAMLLVVAPVTVHNALSGDFVLISSNAGVNAFIGNNPEATGAFFLPPGSGLDGARLETSSREAAERDRRTLLKPSQVSSFWMSRAASFARTEPASWLRLMGRKTLLAVNHYEIPNHLHFRFVADRFAPGLRRLLPFWIVFPLAGLGAAVVLGGRNRPGVLVAGAALIALAVPVVFFATARYRLPAAPAMLALAGGGVAWLFRRASARDFRRLAAGLLLVSLLIWPTRAKLVREGDYSFNHLTLGEVQRQIGNLDEATLQFKLASETATGRSDAPYRLALLLEERGNRRAAAAAARQMLAENPRDRGALALLARLDAAGPSVAGPAVPRTEFEIGTVLLVEEEDLEGAAAALSRAIADDPMHYRAMVNLAIVRSRQDDFESALALLMQAANLVPGNAQVWKNLAQLFDQEDRPKRAAFSARKAMDLGLADDELRRIVEQYEGP